MTNSSYDQRNQQVEQQTNVVVYQGAEVRIPGAEAIAAHRAALRERLERDACARWGSMATFIQEEGATLPIEASPYQAGPLGERRNLLATLHAADRLLVLGEPGTGKTVALERLAWELCNGTEPVLPVLVRLFHYAGTPLAAWVRATLQQTGQLRLDDDRELAAFLQEGGARCVFLFDGLNEVPPEHRTFLRDELVRWLLAHPRHPVILTSRAQDELWRALRQAAPEAVVVQPIDDRQAQDYLAAHLGARKGAALYARLDARLQAMARTPLLLWLIKEAGAAGESIPGNRGELYIRFVSRLLRRDTERRMDAHIPEARKREALAALAWQLGQGQRLTCSREEAVATAARQLDDPAQARSVVDACARHGLLAGEETVWFAPHQTVQEHFAALALHERLTGEWRRPRLWRGWQRVQRALTGQGEFVLALAAQDWWMETFVQLAGMVGESDADRLARKVLDVNPWLALWCVDEGRAVDDATRAAIEARSAKLLDSPRLAERRRAVAALAALHSDRVIEPLFRAAGDADNEVATLAVRALGDLGEPARALALALLPKQDFWSAIVRYAAAFPNESLFAQLPRVLENLLGLPVVWIPPGPFIMGSDKARDPQAYDDETPQHEVTLPGYWISRAPVTVAQFRAFVRESGYRWDGQGEKQGGDDHPVVHVTWHDALAYCRWQARRTGLAVTLPSEAEWEKAARGADGRIYPWGDKFDEGKCNSSEGGVGTTSAVGRYSPQGDSPYGCVDMAGNVWEWCRTKWENSYRDYRGDDDLEGNAARVVRGGSLRSAVAGNFSGGLR